MSMQMQSPANAKHKPFFTPALGGSLQRKCSGCRNKRQLLQRRAVRQAGPEVVPPIVHEVLRSPGTPLDPVTRAFFEPRFGYDLSQVRIHADARAGEAAGAVKARAFAAGQDLFFAPGKFSPHTDTGKRLLAHELGHVAQEAPAIAREAEPVPIPGSETRGSSWERAASYQPRLRPHVPSAPTIPAPPIPEEQSMPGRCPSADEVRRDLKAENIENRLENEIRRRTNLSRAIASRGAIPESRSMVEQADRAIRQEFGGLLPSGRSFASARAVTVLTPADFALHRVPDPAAAIDRLGDISLTISDESGLRPTQPSISEVLRNLCIADPAHNLLRSEVTAPLFNRLGIDFVREYERYRIGGETSFAGATPQVTLPSESRNMGHITVHEAMHFYVSDTYRATAEAHALRRQLMEGGAEFLARHVIHQRLGSLPQFQINYNTYADEFSYVRENLLRGGLSSFSLAYFQGHTDLLGLPPRSIRPKLEVSQPGDKYEREADLMAERVLRMEKPELPSRDFGPGQGSIHFQASQGEAVNHRRVSGSNPQILQRDLALELPEEVPDQPDLTDAQVQAAIRYNRASYSEDSIRLIQDLVGAEKTGTFDETTVRLVARIQRDFGLVPADGKVGPNTYDLLIRELQAEGTAPGTCLTLFQIVGPEPLTFFRNSPTHGTIGSRFFMRARFDPRCNCEDFEYRQYIAGNVELHDVAGPVFNLNSRFVVPGGLQSTLTEDGDSTIPAGDALHNYGYRRFRGNPNCDRYLPDRRTGCEYEGCDFPELTPIPAAAGDAGDRYDWTMRFRGVINRKGHGMVEEKYWAIRGSIVLPPP